MTPSHRGTLTALTTGGGRGIGASFPEALRSHGSETLTVNPAHGDGDGTFDIADEASVASLRDFDLSESYLEEPS